MTALLLVAGALALLALAWRCFVAFTVAAFEGRSARTGWAGFGLFGCCMLASMSLYEAVRLG